MIRGNLEDLEHAPQDADGSAKVAIIGIERSIAAWAGLHHHRLLPLTVRLLCETTRLEEGMIWRRDRKALLTARESGK
jgi:hypothetical protein